PMAMGIPVVATRVPGTREAVRHGETGLTVPLGDADGLAAALALLIGDPALRSALGARARAVAIEEFDERTVIETLRTIYRARLRSWRESRARALESLEREGIPNDLHADG